MKQNSNVYYENYYLSELDRIKDIKSSKKRYSEMLSLAQKWADDKEIKQNITDTFCQLISEMILDRLERYRPLSIKEKIIKHQMDKNLNKMYEETISKNK